MIFLCYVVGVNQTTTPNTPTPTPTGATQKGCIIMANIKKNESVKAFTRWMSKNDRLTWEQFISTSPERSNGHLLDQWQILDMFSRHYGDGEGATKVCHVLEHIVIKRHKRGGYLPEIRNGHGTGNQLIDEAKCYERYAMLPEADLLCPVIKYFTSKSDKVSATSETMQHNVVIIAQKAVKIGDAMYMCRKAEQMNAEHGYIGESARVRYRKLEEFSESQNWRDALYNPGNSGIIFDYYSNCYKAVFIDYAL